MDIIFSTNNRLSNARAEEEICIIARLAAYLCMSHISTLNLVYFVTSRFSVNEEHFLLPNIIPRKRNNNEVTIAQAYS